MADELLPPSYTFGKVVGRVVRAIADTAEDVDDKPQARAAVGTVTFTPSETLRKVADDGTGKSVFVTQGPEDATLSSSGRILDKEGRQGIWLVTGVYRVTFNLADKTQNIPAFNITVLDTHTDLNPLDLADAAPPTLPPNVTLQQYTLPSSGTPGQVLTKTDAGATWSDPGTGAGTVTSVNGVPPDESGDVALTPEDLGGVSTTDPRLSDQRVPTDGSVTNAKVATGAGISLDKTADGATRTAMTATERTKLNGIATGATANSTDAQLRDRSTHTGTQPQSSITGLTTALGAKADLVGGVIPTSQIPAIALGTSVAVANQAAMLALTPSQVQPGDLAVRPDGTYMLTADDPSILGNWRLLTPPSGAVASVNGQTGVVVLGKADVGLGSVDNTSDASKPVSTPQQTALNLKADKTQLNYGVHRVVLSGGQWHYRGAVIATRPSIPAWPDAWVDWDTRSDNTFNTPPPLAVAFDQWTYNKDVAPVSS